MKKRLKYYLYPSIHLYRTYKYNLYTEDNRRPSTVIRNLLETTRKLLTNRKTVLFYPEFPSPGSTINQILFFLGYAVTNNPDREFDLAIKWKDATFTSRDDNLRRLISKNINVLNIDCEDISKVYVDKLFHSIFGYSVTANPLTHTGKCVVKSNLNAQHAVKTISCPIATLEPDVVYNKLIDSTVEDGVTLTHRVLIFRQVIPFVYLQKNAINKRFDGIGGAISFETAQPQDVFSKDEIRKILNFCQQIGLDYGELDVLRDKDDRKLYIVDANNTAHSTILRTNPLKSPPDKRLISPKKRLIMLQRLAQSFQDMMNR